MIEDNRPHPLRVPGLLTKPGRLLKRAARVVQLSRHSETEAQVVEDASLILESLRLRLRRLFPIVRSQELAKRVKELNLSGQPLHSLVVLTALNAIDRKDLQTEPGLHGDCGACDAGGGANRGDELPRCGVVADYIEDAGTEGRARRRPNVRRSNPFVHLPTHVAATRRLWSVLWEVEFHTEPGEEAGELVLDQRAPIAHPLDHSSGPGRQLLAGARPYQPGHAPTGVGGDLEREVGVVELQIGAGEAHHEQVVTGELLFDAFAEEHRQPAFLL